MFITLPLAAGSSHRFDVLLLQFVRRNRENMGYTGAVFLDTALA